MDSPEANQKTALSYLLMINLAEQLKLPFMQIQRQAELIRLTGKQDISSIETSADYALKLIDNYLLGLKLNNEKLALEQEPVSVAAVLYDSGQLLDGLAKKYGVKLELNISGKYEPVMAHRQGLESALVSLGTSLIEAAGVQNSPQCSLQLATHRCRYGIVAGVYSNNPGLSTELLRQGRKLIGSARQPLVNLTYSAGAGIFVADSILRAMSLSLKASRHHRLYGIGAVMRGNQQLQLV
jgi:K+-sensing histidine kinase KdpD